MPLSHLSRPVIPWVPQVQVRKRWHE